MHLRDLLSIGFEILAFDLSYNSYVMKIRDQGDIDVWMLIFKFNTGKARMSPHPEFFILGNLNNHSFFTT